MTDDTNMPEPIECTIYLLLDEVGDYAACSEFDEIGDVGSHLIPGYRIIVVNVNARRPVDAEVTIDAPDEAPAAATASVTP